ncbi:MAG: 2Fe-2S iron-sulfur cluster-binding protein, partial [Methylotenera sp.]
PAKVKSEVIADEAAAAFEINTKTSINFTIELTKSGTTIQCAPDQFVLDAARAAGLRLASSCSKGLCGTCKSKLISGKVDMKHGGGIRQREIDQGMFLPCCSKPLENLVIEK